MLVLILGVGIVVVSPVIGFVLSILLVPDRSQLGSGNHGNFLAGLWIVVWILVIVGIGIVIGSSWYLMRIRKLSNEQSS